jgi:hypothetical protein
MTSKKPGAKAPAKKKTEKAAGGRGKKAAPPAEETKPYPDDLGMRWFNQGAHLPDDAHNTEKEEDEMPSGRLRLTRTEPGGWHRRK